jgi:predicted ABC-type ATPase
MAKLRIFAGPNGSGKSSMYDEIKDKFVTQNYINADNIEKTLNQTHYFNFKDYGLTVTRSQFLNFYYKSGYSNALLGENFDNIFTIENDVFKVDNFKINSYLAALLSDFIRYAFIEKSISFCFETVMSDKRKLDIMRLAKSKGFRIYLYFVATEDVRINIERVKMRVQKGGHNVTTEKIRSRYPKTLDLLYDAIKLTDRAYLFDNSDTMIWFAEITDGRMLELKTPNVPNWYIHYIEAKSSG